MKKRHRVYVQNVSVCTGTTHTCGNTCVRVVPVHTGTFWTYTRGRVEWTHGVSKAVSHTNTHINTHNTTHHDTTHHDHNTTRRKTETEKEDRDRERREDGRGETRQEKRRQKKTEEKSERRFFFQCGGAWPFFVGVVIFRLIPFARETLACWTMSRTIHSRFQCALAN